MAKPLLKGHARIKGLIYVEFNIGPDGRAKNPKMVPEKSSLKNSALNACLFEGITSWDFPVDPTGKEITVIYSLPLQRRTSKKYAEKNSICLRTCDLGNKRPQMTSETL